MPGEGTYPGLGVVVGGGFSTCHSRSPVSLDWPHQTLCVVFARESFARSLEILGSKAGLFRRTRGRSLMTQFPPPLGSALKERLLSRQAALGNRRQKERVAIMSSDTDSHPHPPQPPTLPLASELDQQGSHTTDMARELYCTGTCPLLWTARS